MEKEFKPIIQIRDENGRFCKPIELGEHFLSDIHAMESSLRWLGLQTVQVKNQINQLNWKINSIITNRIAFNCHGINFSGHKNILIDSERNALSRTAEAISESLFALIDDFNKHRESGDPKVWYDHICLLTTVYFSILRRDSIIRVLTDEQKNMIAKQFWDCYCLFNASINSAIANNNWNYLYNMTSAFFGGAYGYQPIQCDNRYLQNCLIDYR